MPITLGTYYRISVISFVRQLIIISSPLPDKNIESQPQKIDVSIEVWTLKTLVSRQN